MDQMYRISSAAYTFFMRQLKHFTIIGIIFVIITGSLAHFLYDWTDDNYIVGLFVPINESIWEHMKLLFFPMLIYSLIMSFIFKGKYPCITSSLCLGILTGTLLIPVFYYAYTYILGKNNFILDIATFIMSILIAFRLSYRLSLSCRLKPYTLFIISLVCMLFVCFVVFTYHPPATRLFEDPQRKCNNRDFHYQSLHSIIYSSSFSSTISKPTFLYIFTA